MQSSLRRLRIYQLARAQAIPFTRCRMSASEGLWDARPTWDRVEPSDGRQRRWRAHPAVAIDFQDFGEPPGDFLAVCDEDRPEPG